MLDYSISLFLLFTLLGLINAKPPSRVLSIILIAVGLLLAFFPPQIRVNLPWELIIGLTIPLLLWQNARRIFYGDWQSTYIGVIYWLIVVTLYSLLFAIGDLLLWPGAMLFGLIVASVIWRAGESESTSSYFSQVGPLILIILLVETVPALETPEQYLGSVFSGAAIGIAIALLAYYLSRDRSPAIRDWLTVGHLYAAYWLAYLMGVSAVSATLVAIISFVGLGLYKGYWPHGRLTPQPLNSWAGFGSLLILFLFLGWQTHQALTFQLLIELVIGLGIGVLAIWAGMRLGLPSFKHLKSLLQAVLRVAVFLLPALLLWPRVVLEQTILFVVAVIITALILVLSNRMAADYLQKIPED